MSKMILAALLATGMAASAPAFAQTTTTATKADQTFLTKAIEGNFAEIEMGKLAQEKGQSQGVKDFGAMLVQDHTDGNTKAMDLAHQMNVSNTPTAPTKKQMADHERLMKLSGDKFDAEFAKHMTMDHKEDIAEYTKQSKMKSDDPTASFAAQTLPVLQKHLQAAEGLEKSKK